jgi:hypothetical protein
MKIGILGCSALTYYVNAAQKKMNTEYPLIEIDRNYHDRPKVLRSMLEEALAKFPKDTDTILVAMGACGNCWEGISLDKKLVIPRMDDCVTILLHKNNEWYPNLKKPGHFYQIDEDNEHFLLTTMYKNAVEKYGERRAKRICDRMFESYTNVEIIDTGVFDCYAEEFVAKMQREADFIYVPLGYVEGSNVVMEKLVSGQWDDQFVIVEPGTVVEGRMFLEV